MEGGEAGGGGGGLLQQILSLRLVPRMGNGTTTYSSPLSTFPEMWYGVFLWAVVSSLAFHVPAALLALFTLRHHKYGRGMSVSVLLMGIVGPITAGTLTRVGPYPVSSPASGIPNVPVGCRAKRAFTLLSTWRKISQRFGVSARTG
uniref:Transmembrane protein 170A n=1 Tax=Ficedula albicollis TaxID=59894 RepID=A0A803VZS7_FICAL